MDRNEVVMRHAATNKRLMQEIEDMLDMWHNDWEDESWNDTDAYDAIDELESWHGDSSHCCCGILKGKPLQIIKRIRIELGEYVEISDAELAKRTECVGFGSDKPMKADIRLDGKKYIAEWKA